MTHTLLYLNIGTPDLLIILLLIGFMFISCFFIAWYLIKKIRHKERLMLIEKGVNVEEISNSKTNNSWLKIGIVIIGLSVGLVIIGILSSLQTFRGSGNAFALAIMGICCGTSMILANYIDKAKS